MLYGIKLNILLLNKIAFIQKYSTFPFKKMQFNFSNIGDFNKFIKVLEVIKFILFFSHSVFFFFPLVRQ